MKIKITEKQAGERLDKVLTESIPDISRSQFQKLIKQESILVNDNKVSSHYKLKEGDEIDILDTEVKIDSSSIEEDGSPKFDLSDIEIIEDNDEFLIINKPAGLTVHGGEGIGGVTLADLLLTKYPEFRKIGEDPARPGIVHRLDREASGLMVIPKTQDSFDNIKNQFQKRTTEKEYITLVYDAVSKEGDEITFPVKRSSNGYKMAAMPITDKEENNADKEGVKRAITEFKVLERFINFTLLKVKIKTGRTHQIRVHMLAYGHPIVGDNLYSTVRSREKNKKIKLDRVFLVAKRLSFVDLSGKKREFEIDLPDDLKEVLRKVK